MTSPVHYSESQPCPTFDRSADLRAGKTPVLTGPISDRDHHYGHFYGLHPLPEFGSRPRIAVVGNCQAESLRIVLDSSRAIDSFRIPPIHEWTDADMPVVFHALTWANVLVTQPVRDNYRGLPCGSSQLEKMMRDNSLEHEAEPHIIHYPVLRFSALNPWWAIVRSPLDTSLTPPLVPYHDLRLIAHIAGLAPLRVPDFLGIMELNVQAMHKREQFHATVVMSDVLQTAPAWHTLNHPDNATLLTLGRRVKDAISQRRSQWAHLKEPASAVASPADREMLGNLRQPFDSGAVDALLPSDSPVRASFDTRTQWTVHGETIPQYSIDEAHRTFYTEHPEFISTALDRHADLLRLLGYGELIPR